MRDTQKSRVYDAEETAAHAVGMNARRQTIPNRELQQFVDHVLRTRAVRSRWPGKTIDVQLKRGGRAYGYGHRITLPMFARNEWVLLHEMAHCLNRAVTSHGPEFAGILLFLVRTALGKKAGTELLAAYRKHRVRYNMNGVPRPRKVPTLAEKAARARAAKQRPMSAVEAREAAESIRRAVNLGVFGPSGRKPRVHALATARLLENAAKGRVAIPVADPPRKAAATAKGSGSSGRHLHMSTERYGLIYGVVGGSE